ncbi:hypothetical protein [Paenibacillus sp. FSL H8-0259]|nr:hypothetical protein [Paenibacillus sp. FSL H8-0259]
MGVWEVEFGVVVDLLAFVKRCICADDVPIRQEEVITMVELKGTIQVDVLNMQPVQNVIEIMQEVVNDDHIPVDIRKEYQERFDAIKWEIPSLDDIEQDFKSTAARMQKDREQMYNRNWRLIGRIGTSNAEQA